MIPLRRLPVISLVALAALAPGCGKKGPPLPPLRPVPAAVETLTARRLGDTVRLEFAIPDKNLDGSRPVDLTRIEVYGLTVDPSGRQPDLDEFLEKAVVVATIDVRPPLAADAPVSAEAPADPRPAQGATVSVEERLTPEMRAPVTFDLRPGAAAVPAPTAMVEPGERRGATGESARTYLALGVSGRNRWSPPSARLDVTLQPAPDPPAGLKLTYAETAFSLAWDPLPPDPWMPVWWLMKYLPGFNVYEMPGEAGKPPAVQPLNAKPQLDSTFEVPLTAFDVRRCFAVRALETIGERTIESELSPAVCATPVDTFAPAAPAGLAAVSGPGGINLIWNANTEPDLAGYLVLRGAAPGETLRAMTPLPIRETTYRDTDVRPGARYVYVVVAVDGATPPNISAQSARVEETAR